jgi:hypothetical protein
MTVLKRIMGICEDPNKKIDVAGTSKLSDIDEIDDSFFDVTNQELMVIEQKVNNTIDGVVEFEGCGGIKLPIDVLADRKSQDEIINENSNNSKIEKFEKSLEDIANDPKWKSLVPGLGLDLNLLASLQSNIILGLPRIDLEDCIVYLVYMLRAQEYEVRYTYPNLLYISWKHHEKDYILKGSPIMSAMLATQSTKPSGELRGQSGSRVRFAENILMGSKQTSRNMPTNMPTTNTSLKNQKQSQGYNPFQEYMHKSNGLAPARNIMEYQPPTSFLDAIERPIAEPRKSALDDLLQF